MNSIQLRRRESCDFFFIVMWTPARRGLPFFSLLPSVSQKMNEKRLLRMTPARWQEQQLSFNFKLQSNENNNDEMLQ